MFNTFRRQDLTKYLFNCFILVIPILGWNLLLTDKLPDIFQPAIFWKEIPAWVKFAENTSRSLLFAIMLLCPLQIKTPFQRKGLLLYLIGLSMYFTSWLMLLCFPDHSWSRNLPGFLAPAYTPIVWLTGIGIMSGTPFIHLRFVKQIYWMLTIIFTISHCGHTYLIFHRSISHEIIILLPDTEGLPAFTYGILPIAA